MQDKGLKDIIEATYTDRKVKVSTFTDLKFSNIYHLSDPFMLPVIDFPTNDLWKEVAAMDDGDSYPMVLKSQYGEGMIYILSIPDTYSDLYKIPAESLSLIRNLLLDDMEVILEAPAQVSIFPYDNSSYIVHSFLPHKTDVGLRIKHSEGHLVDLLSGEELRLQDSGNEMIYRTSLSPYSYRVLKWNSK
jgi:hypothetical protein